LESFERLEDRRQVVAVAFAPGCPVIHVDTVGPEEECHALRAGERRFGGSPPGDLRLHRIEQRERHRCSETAQHRAPGNLPRPGHWFSPRKPRLRNGSLRTTATTSARNRYSSAAAASTMASTAQRSYGWSSRPSAYVNIFSLRHLTNSSRR